VLKSSQCDKKFESAKDACKTKTDPCEEFNRLRRESAEEMFAKGRGGAGGACGDGGDGGKKSDEEKNKQLKLKCFVGALGALLAGGFVCIIDSHLCSFHNL